MDWTFISGGGGGVDVSTHLFIDHRHVNFFYSRVKFSRLVSFTKLFFNSENFPDLR